MGIEFFEDLKSRPTRNVHIEHDASWGARTSSSKKRSAIDKACHPVAFTGKYRRQCSAHSRIIVHDEDFISEADVLRHLSRVLRLRPSVARRPGVAGARNATRRIRFPRQALKRRPFGDSRRRLSFRSSPFAATLVAPSAYCLRSCALMSILFARTEIGLACTRFRRHRVRCFDGAGGGSWRDGSSPGNSSLRRCA